MAESDEDRREPDLERAGAHVRDADAATFLEMTFATIPDGLAAFDRDWCRPLLRAIQRRQLTALRLIADGVEYMLRPAAAWRVWRRRAPAGSGP